ncbi:MauE/DoxX family redox-associated membrane protein [Paractinoplanes rishiriensis]|uniref:Methylamine utilisation protein MauE domain-containing protein n=1 Tax=Paractinoplanes rishiriensis TaxID=1050105 RepID=A0A919MY10_9ACTN|nr:MauE/DoxX family redox-associated membrane protein [Actinoplanes rishiriensis]GIE99578.1 hypothetical protein Ari01nite_70430 [Actinoplanes rishiriensis]
MRVVIASIILLIAGVLVVSLAGKLRGRAAFRGFAAAVVEMGLVRPRLGRPVAALAIGAEATVLVLLAWPAGTVPGLAAAALLFAGFTAALAVAVRRGARAGCHCFGASSTPVARRHVLRGGFLGTVAAAAAVLAPAGPLTGISAPQALTAAAAAAVGVAALVWLDDLVWLFRRATPTA